ncbi:MAG: tetratricopeptide repeat protein, partial [Treponema sp.]|nr:tetratricopeptide repeat protein [Treponema sp.]
KAASAANLLNKSENLKAMRAAKAAIEKDPKNAEAHFLLGKAYLADKRDEQAFREYKSASRLGITGKDIPEIEFRETIASLYVKFHEEEEALKEYVVLIKQQPDNPEYYYQAGKLFSSRKRPDLAEQYLRKAVTLSPKDTGYRFELGMFYYLSKKIKEAGVELETVLKQNPLDGQTLLYMGKILKDAKDFEGALPYLEKAARDQEYKLRGLVELGNCYMSLKMMDKAAVELERAVSIIQKEADPDSLYARYYLAMCYEKTQEFTKAIAQWDKIYAEKKNFRDVGEKLTQYIEYRLGTEETSTRKS